MMMSMTDRILVFIVLGVVFSPIVAYSDQLDRLSVNVLSYEIHETFVGKARVASEKSLYLTIGRKGEQFAYLVGTGGGKWKVNVSAIQNPTDSRDPSVRELVGFDPGNLITRFPKERTIVGDFDSNGKLDFVYVSSAYEELIFRSNDSKAKKLDWGGNECGNVDLLISMNDMKFNVLLHLDSGSALDLGGMQLVAVAEHKPALRSSSAISREMWKILREKIFSEGSKFGCLGSYFQDIYFGKIEVIDDIIFERNNDRFKPVSIDWAVTQPQYKRAMEYYSKFKKWEDYAFSSLAKIVGANAYYAFYDFDPDNMNVEYTAFLNDVAYYTASFKKDERHEFAIPMLIYVLQRDPNRIPAYLNLADAEYDAHIIEWPEKMRAASIMSYREYFRRMEDAGKKSQIPKRVIERMNEKPAENTKH